MATVAMWHVQLQHQPLHGHWKISSPAASRPLGGLESSGISPALGGMFPVKLCGGRCVTLQQALSRGPHNRIGRVWGSAFRGSWETPARRGSAFLFFLRIAAALVRNVAIRGVSQTACSSCRAAGHPARLELNKASVFKHSVVPPTPPRPRRYSSNLFLPGFVLQVDVMKNAYNQGLECDHDEQNGDDGISPKDVGHNIYILAHQVRLICV